jgi:beta-glucosidase
MEALDSLRKGIDDALQPFVSLDRDLAFKRAYNTFGEDPLLTSQIGAAEIRGIQSQQVMAVAKHFIGFDTPGSDVWIDDRTLHEVYLPPFEAAVKAGVAAVMCSYNHVNGPYACGKSSTLNKILRGRQPAKSSGPPADTAKRVFAAPNAHTPS